MRKIFSDSLCLQLKSFYNTELSAVQHGYQEMFITLGIMTAKQTNLEEAEGLPFLSIQIEP